MHALAIYTPYDLDSSVPPPLSDFGWRFLAEGDSWFTIGSLNPARNSNLLFEMVFRRTACVVNCAYPGDELRKMVQMNRDPRFASLLAGRAARHWDALLLSAGGNDLIAALAWMGDAVPRCQRLLLKPGEWGDPALGPARYVCDEGWQTFARYLKENLRLLVELRDRGPSSGVPLFMHGYAVPMPRPAGAGLGLGPWLWPALRACGIPQQDDFGLAQVLIGRLAAVLAECAADASTYPNLHVFDSTVIPLRPASAHSRGASGDWVNEIHLTRRGYAKIAGPWSAAIESTLLAWYGF